MRWMLVSSFAAAALPAGVAGQRVVELPAQDRPLSGDFAEVYRIGGASAPEWAAFQRVHHMAFDGRGRLFIADPAGRRIVVVGPEGRLERTLGRAGEGPGEFRSLSALTASREGDAIAYDFALRRFMVFPADGGASVTRHVDPMRELPGMKLRALPDGSVISAQLGLSMLMSQGETKPGVGILRHDVRNGRPGAEVYRAWYPADQIGGGVRTRGSTRLRWKGFESGVFVGVLPDGGFALADSTDYKLKIFGPEHTLTHILLRRAVTPLRVTPRMIEREKEARRERWNQSAGGATMSGAASEGTRPRPASPATVRLEGYLDDMVFPDHVPVIANMGTDWAGRIWVERTGTDPWTRGPTDVLAADGTYLASLAASQPGVPEAFGPGGLLAYIEKDELDAPVIVVRRAPPQLR